MWCNALGTCFAWRIFPGMSMTPSIHHLEISVWTVFSKIMGVDHQLFWADLCFIFWNCDAAFVREKIPPASSCFLLSFWLMQCSNLCGLHSKMAHKNMFPEGIGSPAPFRIIMDDAGQSQNNASMGIFFYFPTKKNKDNIFHHRNFLGRFTLFIRIINWNGFIISYFIKLHRFPTNRWSSRVLWNTPLKCILTIFIGVIGVTETAIYPYSYSMTWFFMMFSALCSGVPSWVTHILKHICSNSHVLLLKDGRRRHVFTCFTIVTFVMCAKG